MLSVNFLSHVLRTHIMYPLMISVDSPFKSSVVSIDYNVELEEDNVQLRDIVKKQKKKPWFQCTEKLFLTRNIVINLLFLRWPRVIFLIGAN